MRGKKKSKPAKPYKDFPLHAHASGQWARKIRGKLRYFGVWADPDAALKRMNYEMPYLREGRQPPAVDVSGGCTIRQLCNEFLRSKEMKMNAGELAPKTFIIYHAACERLIEHFGRDRLVGDITPDDFRGLRSKLAARYGVVSLRCEITRVRTIFGYAFKNNLIDKPISFGADFDRPSAKAIRKNRNEGGAKIFTRDEALRIIAEVRPVIRAMCLLGLNCGFGNTDVASLPQKAVDLDTGWIDFPRPKTEINRRIPLWPETISALREAAAIRPKPANASCRGLYFLTCFGRPWVRVKKRNDNSDVFIAVDSLGNEFKKTLRKLGINGRRRLGFYTFRHCFETHAGECKDQVAVDAIMGHVDLSMGANYRHGVSDERLRAVVNTVHDWLWPEE